jgi:hypothetical protein
MQSCFAIRARRHRNHNLVGEGTRHEGEGCDAIRRAISDEETGDETRTHRAASIGEEAGVKRRSDCRSRLCVQQVDRNREEARADVRGCGSRNASPHAEVMAGQELARRGRANGAGRNRTGYSRTLTTIPRTNGPRFAPPPHCNRLVPRLSAIGGQPVSCLVLPPMLPH